LAPFISCKKIGFSGLIPSNHLGTSYVFVILNGSTGLYVLANMLQGNKEVNKCRFFCTKPNRIIKFVLNL
jgi:hypothetical protein